jgi:eukaryotic-like serine/threonine-protein kinase
VHGVAFAPNGRTLATTGFDQTIRLWDVSNRDQPQQLGQPLTGHTGAVQGLAFTPDGNILATTSTDQTIRLWDLSDHDRPHQLGQPLEGHTDEVIGVAFDDRSTLATTSTDKTVRLWQLPGIDKYHGSEVREACRRAGAALDEATWTQYTDGLSYQDTCADHLIR